MGKFLIISIFAITGITIGYINSNKNNHYIPFSKLVDTKTIHGIKPNWIITNSYYCVGTCKNYYSSSSSWGSSSYGGGK